MKALLNIIWLIFGGLWLSLGYFLAGIIAMIFIVTVPFGIASFRMASFALWPFGRVIVDKHLKPSGWSLVGNIVWMIFFGIPIAVGHVTTAIPMFISIIGIPLGLANLKMIPVSLFPLGKEIVATGRIEAFYEGKITK